MPSEGPQDITNYDRFTTRGPHMKNTTDHRLLLGIAAALAVSGASQAQESPPPADTSHSMLEVITVTATRRVESQQEVPIAISAYSAAELKALGAQNVQDLSQQTPGLMIANQSAAITPFIRGIGAADNTVGQEAAVSTYVDGVYYPSVYGALFTFNNIESIEVLKGPQGTLFGRNATGGLVQVRTRDPSEVGAVEGSVSYGNLGTAGAKLYGTTGIAENLAADLAVVYREQQDGFGRNLTTGRDVGFVGDDFSVRNKWLWKPGDATKVTVALDYGKSKNSDIGSAKNLLPGAIATADGLPQAAGYHNVRGGMHEFVNTEQWGAAVHLTQEFGAFDLVSISSYRDTEVVQQFDNDVTPVVFLDAYIDSQSTETISQELQILSRPDSHISWIAGLYYLNDDSGFVDPLGLGLYGVAVGGTGVQIKNSIETESYSAFGEASIPLGERTVLTLGARWTNDKRDISGRTDVVDSNVPPGNLIISLPSPSNEIKQDEPSWRLVLKHEFSDELMVYGSYNRGFKSGNYNTVSAADEPFEAEQLDAYEIGIKSQAFGNRVRLNAAAFYYDYSNLQLAVLTGSFLTTTNAADSEVKGIDLDGEWFVTDQLRLRFGASFLDTEFQEYPNAQCSSRGANGITTQFSCDVTGNSLTRSPEQTFNLAAFYTIPTSIGDIDANLSYAYNSGFFYEPDNRLEQPSYSVVNAQVGWKQVDESWGVTLYGRNLADEEYSVWMAGFALGDVYAAAPGRTWGAEVNFKF